MAAGGENGSTDLVRYAEITTGIWLLNVMVGGSYIVFAKVGDFPEWLSLLHLVVGVGAFLAAVFLMFAVRFSTTHHAKEAHDLVQAQPGEQE